MTRLLHEKVLGAAGAGCVSTVLGHPLDTIKIHLQTAKKYHHSSAWQVAKSLRYGLWRGISPPLVHAMVMNTVMFTVFDTLKLSLVGDKETSSSSSSSSSASTRSLSLLAGVGSGFATACISTPADYVKIQAQLSSTPISSFEIVRRSLLVKNGKNHNHNNPTIFYRGHVANLLREGIFTMVYLGFYDQAHPQGLTEVALTSGMTGALAWVASYPADTIKTVCQAQGLSFQEAATQVWWSRGSGSGGGSIANFYKGCGASTGRAILVTTSRMIVYEWIVGHFDR